MSENLHDIDKIFKDAIDDHEEQPAPSVWNAIDQNLDKNKVVHIRQKYRNLLQVSAVLLIIITVMSVYQVKTWKNIKSITARQQPANNNPTANNNNNSNSDNNIIHHNNANTAADHPLNGKQSTNDAYQNGKLESENLTAAEGSDSPAGTKKLPGESQSTSEEVSAPEKEKPHDNASPMRVVNPVTKENKNSKTEHIGSSANKQRMNGKGNKKEEQLFVAERAQTGTQVVENFPVKHDLSFQDFSFAGDILIRYPDSISMPFVETAPVDKTAMNKIRLTPTRHFPLLATVFVSRDFSSNRLVSDLPRHREDEKDAISRSEENKSGSSYGLLLEYPLRRNWSLESGLVFSKNVISVEPKTIYARQDDHGKVRFRFSCSSGYSFLPEKAGRQPSFGDSMTIAGSKNTLSYVSIPFAVKYEFNYGKFSLAPEAGFMVNLLTGENIETTIDNGTTKEKTMLDNISGMKSSYYSAIIGVGAKYQLNDNVAFVFKPAGKLAITSINENTPVKSYPQSLSLIAGIQVGF